MNFDVSIKTDKTFREINQSKKIKNLNKVLKNWLRTISQQYIKYYDFKWKFMTYNVEDKV